MPLFAYASPNNPPDPVTETQCEDQTEATESEDDN